MPPSLLDTDILSAVMRKHPLVTARAHTYLARHGSFTLSIITRGVADPEAGLERYFGQEIPNLL